MHHPQTWAPTARSVLADTGCCAARLSAALFIDEVSTLIERLLLP